MPLPEFWEGHPARGVGRVRPELSKPLGTKAFTGPRSLR
jgi:hypothetical protein